MMRGGDTPPHIPQICSSFILNTPFTTAFSITASMERRPFVELPDGASMETAVKRLPRSPAAF